MGENVRYDGGHRYTRLLVERLGDLFDLHPICPEVGIGMGVPRNPIQLTNTKQGIRVRDIDNNSLDFTRELEQFAIACLQEPPEIYGYIFKSRSPSCGVNDVKLYDEAGQLLNSGGTGIHAKTIIKTIANLPVADENQLQEIKSIDNYSERVISYYQSRNPSQLD